MRPDGWDCNLNPSRTAGSNVVTNAVNTVCASMVKQRNTFTLAALSDTFASGILFLQSPEQSSLIPVPPSKLVATTGIFE